MRRVGRLSALLVGLVAALSLGRTPTIAADDGNAPSHRATAQASLIESAKALARKGYPDEMRAFFDMAEEAGVDPASLEKERQRAERRVALLRKPAKHVKGAIRHVEAAVEALAAELSSTEDTNGAEGMGRADLIRLILRIDSDCEAARAAGRQVRSGHGWVTERVAACLDRRDEIAKALLAARQLEVPITMGVSNSRVLLGVYGEKGRVARWGRVSIHAANVPEEKMRRVLREAVRATAVGRYLLTGRMQLPKLRDKAELVWLDASPLYDKAIDWCRDNGQITRKDESFLRSLGSFVAGGTTRVCKPRPEASMQTILVEDIWSEAYFVKDGDRPQPTLKVGHLNFVCLSYLGTGLPSYGWKETKEATRGTSDLDAEARKRHEMWRLAEAGLLGSRSWLRYLTEQGEAPAWSKTFRAQMGLIKGDLCLKATFVTQYLHERGLLDDVFKATDKKKATSEVFEAAIGYDLATFENEWREWMLAPDTTVGLLQQLRGAKAEEGPRETTAEERELLDYLDGVRQSCLPGNVRSDVVPLALDAELSAGCAWHAEYLSKNPDQAAAWPDAHEEWPDREGFSPHGGWAGLHSVIAPGSRDARDAIDGWLGTFYHRLPLLDPGLVRIGWGLVKGYAVLDSGSMVAPFPYVTHAMFPPPRATNVPRTFNPELPNPVPGADQSAWGYPITLQVFRGDSEAALSMTLHEGNGPGGPVVDCHYATPDAPTNPEIAPAGAYCLIPKSHLKPGTTYTVVVEGLADWPGLTWHFTTGK